MTQRKIVQFFEEIRKDNCAVNHAPQKGLTSANNTRANSFYYEKIKKRIEEQSLREQGAQNQEEQHQMLDQQQDQEENIIVEINNDDDTPPDLDQQLREVDCNDNIFKYKL